MPTWMPEGDLALAGDDELRSAAKWCSLLVSSGNKPSPFPEGCLPMPGDDLQRLMVKIDILTNT